VKAAKLLPGSFPGWGVGDTSMKSCRYLRQKKLEICVREILKTSKKIFVKCVHFVSKIFFKYKYVVYMASLKTGFLILKKSKTGYCRRKYLKNHWANPELELLECDPHSGRGGGRLRFVKSLVPHRLQASPRAIVSLQDFSGSKSSCLIALASRSPNLSQGADSCTGRE
jgi:hypothetical protein